MLLFQLLYFIFPSAFSCGTLQRDSDMVSRRRILSRSRDDLSLDVAAPEEEEDVWYQRDKLYKVLIAIPPVINLNIKRNCKDQIA